ncbi:MAG: hypothetical protein AB7L09_02330 [Nitrospira sp.]
MSDPDLNHLVKRIHDYLRMQNPVMYRQVRSNDLDGPSLMSSSIIEANDGFWFQITAVGYLRVEPLELPGKALFEMWVDNNDVLRHNAFPNEELLFGSMLPMLDRALLLDDLARA